MESTSWEAWESATVVAARDLLAGDLILGHPDAGPFGPWEVQRVEGGTGHLAGRLNVVADHNTWYGIDGSMTYRVERAS